MFFRCQNRERVLQLARNGKVFFYRICHPHLTKSYIWYHANYLLASTLVFLDGRKINLTEMMTFLVSLRDWQFCWYNILMALLRKKWPYWLAPVSIVKIHVKFEREKYYQELSYLGSSMFRGPVWARFTVQKSVLPTLGDLPAELGYFKIVCHGFKKTVGRAS